MHTILYYVQVFKENYIKDDIISGSCDHFNKYSLMFIYEEVWISRSLTQEVPLELDFIK